MSVLPLYQESWDLPSCSAKQVGLAAEYLVMADLLCRGYLVSQMPEESQYDVILDSGDGLHKIQVKGTRGVQSGRESYHFSLDRPRWTSSGKGYNSYSDVDIFAFVALDIGRIAYLRASALDILSVTFSICGGKNRPIDGFPIDSCI